jgi:hypothetical protein
MPARWWAWWAANWKPVLAAAALVALTLFAISRIGAIRNLAPTAAADPDFDRRILTEQAVRDIDAKEAEYLKAIARLSALAEPQKQQPGSALMASYREKLVVLDAAIAELRANIERNRFNANLRMELVSLYQQKQQTLEAMAQGENHVR